MAAARLRRFEASEESEVVGHDRGPDVGPEAVEPAPGAARQAVGPLEVGDVGLDASAEVPQLAIDPAAPDHFLDDEPAYLVEGSWAALDSESYFFKRKAAPWLQGFNFSLGSLRAATAAGQAF